MRPSLPTLALLLATLPLPAPLRAEVAPGRLIEVWGGQALDEEARLEPASGLATADFDPGTRSVAAARLSGVTPGATWGVMVEIGYQSTRASNVNLDMLTGQFGVIWDPWRNGGEGWRRLQPHLTGGVIFTSVDGSNEGNLGERTGTLLTNSLTSITTPGLAGGGGVRIPLSSRTWLLAEVQLRFMGLVQDAGWHVTPALDPEGEATLTGAYALLGLSWK